ncbi:hypothetical protein imdm_959 [gamma proteobacterium IMCC2047]|nr:hypothetical protein imdm_959 [gamma proteobacterium IMCC2047]
MVTRQASIKLIYGLNLCLYRYDKLLRFVAGKASVHWQYQLKLFLLKS